MALTGSPDILLRGDVKRDGPGGRRGRGVPSGPVPAPLTSDVQPPVQCRVDGQAGWAVGPSAQQIPWEAAWSVGTAWKTSLWFFLFFLSV